ncbi:MAG: LamG domain-containing protein [Phycisphaerae bacterium]|nr:LamG domain-containing protein [Phycisphaerae bacterium]
MKKTIALITMLAMVAMLASSAQAGPMGAIWNFNDGSGTPPTNTTVTDSLNSNDGTMTNMDPATDWVTGRTGGAGDYALDFYGGTASAYQYVSVPDDDTLDLDKWVVMEAYIKPVSGNMPGSGTAKRLVSKSGAYEFTIRYQRNQFLMILNFSDGTSRTHTIGRTATADVWSHVKFRWNGTDSSNNSQFWLNGVLGYQQTYDVGKTLVSNDNPVLIGSLSNTSSGYTGGIDDVSLTPEPATMTLLLLGLPLALRRRRK